METKPSILRRPYLRACKTGTLRCPLFKDPRPDRLNEPSAARTPVSASDGPLPHGSAGDTPPTDMIPFRAPRSGPLTVHNLRTIYA